jgi:L-rhamnonate dehydratase
MLLDRRGFLSLAAATMCDAVPATGRLQIDAVKASPLRVRAPAPAASSVPSEALSDFDPRRWRNFGPFSQLNGAILVQIRTKEGITGYGMGGGGAAACHIIDTHLSRLLVGADATNIELLWDQLFASTSFYGRRGVVVQAMSGIDLALWDIAGKRAGLPVYRLLGGQYRNRVPGYYTGNDVERGLELGFRAVKLANFVDSRAGRDGMRNNVQKILEARKRIGEDPLLMLDALCAWDVPYTIELAERVTEARLYFLEEPILPDDVDGYTRLCKEVRGTRIASGEHEATIYGFREILRNRAAHILQPDLTWSGGLTDARRVAAAAEAAGVPLIPHRGGSVYGMTLLLTTRTASLAESFGTGDSGNEVMELLTPKLVDGDYLAPEGPGFGVDFSDRILRAYAPQLI